MTRRSPPIPPARVHQCADGARPGPRRVLGALRRCSGPMTIVVLAITGTLVLYLVSAWLMLDATNVSTLAAP